MANTHLCENGFTEVFFNCQITRYAFARNNRFQNVFEKKNTMSTNGHTFAAVLTPVSRNTTIALTRYRITLSI